MSVCAANRLGVKAFPPHKRGRIAVLKDVKTAAAGWVAAVVWLEDTLQIGGGEGLECIIHTYYRAGGVFVGCEH